MCCMLLQALQEAWKKGGVGGVYAGYRAAIVGDIVGAALGFTLFEQGKKAFEKAFHRSPDSVETGIVGMVSSALTLSVVLPCEVVQRRMQVCADYSQGLRITPRLFLHLGSIVFCSSLCFSV